MVTSVLSHKIPEIDLSSRPERSGVEGPCVFNGFPFLIRPLQYAAYFRGTSLEGNGYLSYLRWVDPEGQRPQDEWGEESYW